MYTVVMAAKGDDAHVGEALESIFAQTLPPARVDIVMDSERADQTPWLSAIARAFPAVQIRNQPGHGLASALSFGIHFVETPYVAFLDCDDLWAPEKQQRQVDALAEDASLDAVTCLGVNVKADGEVLIGNQPRVSAMFTSTTFRRAAFDTFGYPDDTASHYTWLYRWWANARREGIRTSNVAYLGLRRRIHDDNSWLSGNAQAHRDLLMELRMVATHKRGEVR